MAEAEVSSFLRPSDYFQFYIPILQTLDVVSDFGTTLGSLSMSCEQVFLLLP